MKKSQELWHIHKTQHKHNASASIWYCIHIYTKHHIYQKKRKGKKNQTLYVRMRKKVIKYECEQERWSERATK